MILKYAIGYMASRNILTLSRGPRPIFQVTAFIDCPDGASHPNIVDLDPKIPLLFSRFFEFRKLNSALRDEILPQG